MATYTPFVKHLSRPRVKPIYGEPIYIRIIAGRQNQYVNTGIRVPIEDWNFKKREVKPNAQNSYEINQVLNQMVMNARSLEMGLRMKGYSITAERMKYELERGGGLSFMEYFEHTIERMSNNPPLAQRYQRALDHLLEFRKQINFGDLDLYFIQQFDTYLQNSVTRSGKPLHTNYIGKIHGWIRSIINKAIMDGATDITNPYLRFKLKWEFVESEFMSQEEFEKVEKVELSGKLDKARDFFLLATYLAGMRANELLIAKKADIETRKDRKILRQHISKIGLDKRRHKYCVIIPKAQAIIDKYEGEYLIPCLGKGERIGSALAIINAALKGVAEKAGVKPFTTKTARKTLINRLAHLKYSSANIASFVGHESSATTEKHYMAFDEDLQQKALSEAFD